MINETYEEPEETTRDTAACVACDHMFPTDEMNCPDEGFMCESCYDAQYDSH